jgi:hypothetical protein
VVTDQVSVTREEQDWHLFKQSRKDLVGGFCLTGTECVADLTIALSPATGLCSVDVQSVGDILAAKVRLDRIEVWGPVHAATRVCVVQTYIVHVDAFAVLLIADSEDFLQDEFAGWHIDVIFSTLVEVLYTLCVLGFDPLCVVGAVFEQAVLFCVGNVREGLVDCRDPSVADEETGEVPFLGLGLGVALEDGFGQIRNVLAGIRFTCDVELNVVSDCI